MDAPPPDDRDPRPAHAVGPPPLPKHTGFYARFLRGGGVVSLERWIALPAVEQDALEAAGEVVARERARMVGEELAILAAGSESASDPVKDAMRSAAEIALRGGA